MPAYIGELGYQAIANNAVYVGSGGGGSGSYTNIWMQTGGAIGAGHTVVVFVYSNIIGATATVNDSLGNYYHQDLWFSDSTSGLGMRGMFSFYYPSGTTGPVYIGFDTSAPSTYKAIRACELSGIMVPAEAVDRTGSQLGLVGTTPSSGALPVLTGAIGDFGLGLVTFYNTGPVFTTFAALNASPDGQGWGGLSDTAQAASAGVQAGMLTAIVAPTNTAGLTFAPTLTQPNVTGASVVTYKFAYAPAPPTLGTPYATGPSVAAWPFTAPADDGGRPIAGYNVRYTGSGTIGAGLVSSPVGVASLIPGHTYQFGMQTYSAEFGAGAWSAWSAALTMPDLVLGQAASPSTGTVSFVKHIVRTLAGSSTSTGVVLFQVHRQNALAGATTSSGAITLSKVRPVTLTGTSTSQGDVTSVRAGSGYRYRNPITIDHTLVAGPLTNFPVLVQGTFGFIRPEPYGGRVHNPAGYDIGFYADQALLQPLTWDIEAWTTSGQFSAWVLLPNLASDVDTTFYIGYGSAEIASFLGGGHGAAWPAGAEAVYHFATAGLLADASEPEYDLAAAAGFGAGIPDTGRIDGGTEVDWSVQMESALTAETDTGTLSFWHMSQAPWNSILIDKSVTPYPGTFTFDVSRGGDITGGYNDGTIHWSFVAADGFHALSAPAPETNGVWAYFHCVWGATGMHLYRNGAEVAADPTTAHHVANAAPWRLGLGGPDLRTRLTWLDEVRIWGVALTPQWIATEYNNQQSPAAFARVGGTLIEQTVEGASIDHGQLVVGSHYVTSLGGAGASSGTVTLNHLFLRSQAAGGGASSPTGALTATKFTLKHTPSLGNTGTASSGAFTPIKRWLRYQTFTGASGSSGGLAPVYWPVSPPVPYIRRYRAEVMLSELSDRTPWQVAEQLSTALGCDFTVYGGRVATWRERMLPNPPDYRCTLADLASYEPDELDIFTRIAATYTDPYTKERGRTEEIIDYAAENRTGLELLVVRDAGSVSLSYATAWAQQQLATGPQATVRAVLGPVAYVSDWYGNPVAGPHVKATQWVYVEDRSPLEIMSTALDAGGNVTLQLGERQLSPAADQARLRREMNQLIRLSSANTGGPA